MTSSLRFDVRTDGGMRAAHGAPAAQRAADFLQRLLKLGSLALEQVTDVRARRGASPTKRGDVRDLRESQAEPAGAGHEGEQR